MIEPPSFLHVGLKYTDSAAYLPLLVFFDLHVPTDLITSLCFYVLWRYFQNTTQHPLEPSRAVAPVS